MTTEDNTQLLYAAARKGNVEDVQRLIPISDPKAADSAALRWAIRSCHLECVKLLIPVSDPKAADSAALEVAVLYGGVEYVKLLIPVCDPKSGNSLALRAATMCDRNDRIECIDLLLDVSDAQVALHCLKTNNPHDSKYWQYLEHKISEQQKNMLTNHLSSRAGKSKPSRKI